MTSGGIASSRFPDPFCESTRPISQSGKLLVRATIEPGQGHGFHYHQEREEFLYILEGEIEQWVNMEKRLCGPGDVIYVPPGVVHGSFNVGDKDARLLAIFGNLPADVELATDVSDQQPWCLLR